MIAKGTIQKEELKTRSPPMNVADVLKSRFEAMESFNSDKRPGEPPVKNRDAFIDDIVAKFDEKLSIRVNRLENQNKTDQYEFKK